MRHLIFVAVYAAVSAIIMLLWNALIPSIIGWTVINYWQAAGLLLLCRLLIGGLGNFKFMGGHHMHNHFRNKKNKNYQQSNPMADFHEKMHSMSRDERREYIRRRMAGMEDHPFTNKED